MKILDKNWTRALGRDVYSNPNLLANAFPSLIQEIHPTKNKELNIDISKLTAGSNKKIWWKCKEGHEWEARINNRTRNVHCPYCKGNKTNILNSLQIKKPELSKEWHPTKNGKLTPSDVTCGSGKKVWWICSKNKKHEWQAQIKYRNSNLSNCMRCYYAEKYKENLLTLRNPELIKEWNLTRNKDLIPETFHYLNNSRQIWWKCSKCNHEWQTTIHSRTNTWNTEHSRCPKCNNYPQKDPIDDKILQQKSAIEKYLNKGCTQKEITDHLNISRRQLEKITRKYYIPTRKCDRLKNIVWERYTDNEIARMRGVSSGYVKYVRAKLIPHNIEK